MSNSIHPTAVIDASVVLGDNNHIGPFCYFTGGLSIGDDNWFEAHCCVGTRPEHTEYWHKDGYVEIGSYNMFRENTTIHAGTNNPTKVGNNIIMLRGSYVGHDCVIEDDVTLACDAIMLGHVYVMKNSNCGSGCQVHQYQVIGSWSMLGMGCIVPKKSSIVPGKVWVGNPAKLLRDNTYKTKNISDKEYAHEYIRWKDILGHSMPTQKV